MGEEKVKGAKGKMGRNRQKEDFSSA